MKNFLLKFCAYSLKAIGVIIGIPGIILSAIGLGLSDVCESIVDYCELENEK